MTPLLLGHRGARSSRETPENTPASFELCLQHGCDGFEFDVRRSADGKLVICHDPTSNGMNIESTAAQTLALPALEDVLQHFATRAFLDIELKVAGMEPQILIELRKDPPQKRYVVSSFLPEVLTVLHDLDATIPLGFLCEKRSELQSWRDAPVQWVIPHSKLADRELIDAVHSAGKKFMVWTVNRVDQMRAFAEWGADAIISDETELLAQALR
ncbi:MAG TPA: glycerophosphodiester phosphodiesterase [Terriglobales bacterium]|nr:glycerophosphodiester phosphodiesterase [Terriglobales bacterium]